MPTPTVRPALILAAIALAACHRDRAVASSGECDPSLTLAEGFCAQIVADSVGPARQIAVRSNGDVIVALLTVRRDSGGVLVLRDTTRDGLMDTRERLGSGSTHGVVLANDSTLYVSTADAIIRYRFTGPAFKPRPKADTIVVGLPTRSPPSHTLALDGRGRLIVNIGTRSNACQAKDGEPHSPGQSPCLELETAGGIWSFPADRSLQPANTGVRLATGLHNAVALAISPWDTMVYAVSHGRDELHAAWPDVVDELAGATRPGEEMVRIGSAHADFGWPYCYFDVIAQRRVVAPEYLGDVGAATRCERAIQPLVAFPAHWSPMALLFYTGAAFPARYRDGVFVAFHGSAFRSPLPEEGYRILFVPFHETLPRVDHEVFADGFAGGLVNPEGARHRPAGLAQGKDGALYVSDDAGGRIWRIVYRAGGGTGKDSTAPR